VKGSAGEHIAAAAFLLNNYSVYHQDNESGGADLLVEKEGELFRVQVKTFYLNTWGKHRPPQQRANIERRSQSKSNDSRIYSEDEVDLFALVDTETAEVFVIPQGYRKTSVNKNSILDRKIYPRSVG